MSVTTDFFIEFKDKESGKWKLLTAYFPFKKSTTQLYSNIEEKWVTEETKPDAITTDGLELQCYDGGLWQQGHVRDMFTHSLSQADFADRGIPDDISEGAKKWFDEALAKQEQMDKDYFEKHGEKRTWGGKWWYSETHVTLQELNREFDKQYNDWCNNLKNDFQEKYLDSELMKKMDEVIATVKGTKIKKKKNEDDNFDNTEYLLGDEFFDLLQLWSFIGKISTLVECFSNDYYSDDEIRVIAYSS